MAAVEQLAIDGNDWDVAAEVLLMQEPPFDSFVRGRPSGRAPHSSLLDERFIEAILAKNADRDALQEKRRKAKATRKDQDDRGGKADGKGDAKGK